MSLSTWSLLGYSIGMIFSILSAVRYFVLYPDEDKAIAYVTIGLIICALAWLYNKQINLNNKLTAVEDFLAEKK
jgi:hypothetical protein